MPEQITLRINGMTVVVARGTSVAVALSTSGQACRRSVGGELRGPLCGMGVCFECRASINGELHNRTCQLMCEPGMEVKTE